MWAVVAKIGTTTRKCTFTTDGEFVASFEIFMYEYVSCGQVFKQDSQLDPELLRLEKDAEDLDKVCICHVVIRLEFYALASF